VVRLLKLIVMLALIGCFIWFGRTVKLGKYTLFGHLGRIWSSKEAGDLKDGAKEKWQSEATQHVIRKARDEAGPALDRVKRGAKAAYEEARRPQPDAGR
jgi:hypothetical protein